MGFSRYWSRPEWMICKNILVPPPQVRPPIKVEGSQRSEDDITYNLSSIIKWNEIVRKTIQKSDKTDDSLKESSYLRYIGQLNYYVAIMIDNQIPKLASSSHRSGRPLKAIKQRLKGKEGRIRGNLMGKRVNFSSRTVITPDPVIDIDD